MNDYPTDAQLGVIANFDWKMRNVRYFLDRLEEAWNKNYGWFDLKGVRVLYLHVATGGWSGNEVIIDALQRNVTFWERYWQQSERGGRHTFKIDLRE